MKNTPSLNKFTVKFIIGIIVGVAGFAFTIMLQVKMPFLANLYSSYWGIFWTFLFIIIGLLGFYLAKNAGWSVKNMDSKLTKEQKKIIEQWLADAKGQKRTIEQWLTAEGKKLKQLEDFIGQPITPIRTVMDLYKQSLPKLDEEIKNLEDELKK